MNLDIPQCILDLAERLRTQDNRCTKTPCSASRPIDWTDPSGGPSSEDFRAWLESNRTALTDYVRSATVRFHCAAPSPGNCLEGRHE